MKGSKTTQQDCKGPCQIALGAFLIKQNSIAYVLPVESNDEYKNTAVLGPLYLVPTRESLHTVTM